MKPKNKLPCEMSYKEKVLETYKSGMLYHFYKWLTKPKRKKEKSK